VCCVCCGVVCDTFVSCARSSPACCFICHLEYLKRTEPQKGWSEADYDGCTFLHIAFKSVSVVGVVGVVLSYLDRISVILDISDNIGV